MRNKRTDLKEAPIKMTEEEYRIWIDGLKTFEISKGNIEMFRQVFAFSPEKHAKRNGMDDSFIKEFQKDRKIIHNRLIDYEKIKALKKRKVSQLRFPYGGEWHTARICFCVKRFKNEEHRARFGYDFYEGIKYNYAIISDSFFHREELILFDEKGNKVYTTTEEFNRHFVDIREKIIDDILK